MVMLIVWFDVELVDWFGMLMGGLIGMVLVGLFGLLLCWMIVNDVGLCIEFDLLMCIGEYFGV